MQDNAKIFNINKKSFMTALIMLFILMVFTYVLTFVLPSGEYSRVITNGTETVVADTYTPVEGGIGFVKWLFSPILALGATGGGTAIAIIAFLLILGGAFNALDDCGILAYMLSKIYHKYSDKKYKLLFITTLFFMFLGSFIGSFEECVPMVPIAVALAYSLGWDAMIGMGMSIFAVGCGFATGVFNPFTVGIAQQIASLPMFSGMGFRMISFVVVFAMLIVFLFAYAKKIDKDPTKSVVYDEQARDKWIKLRNDYVEDVRKDKALKCFALIIGVGILCILLSSMVSILQSLILPITALIFLAAGTVSSFVSGMSKKDFFRQFGKGIVSILPAVLLILLASSIRYTLTEAKVIDTILYKAVGLVENSSTVAAILVIYLLVFIMDIFIASGSAKAFFIMPILAPLADLSGITRQLTVLAFTYGDGFSNLFYPTNPVLLISLGIVGLSYGKWMKWSWKFQLALLAVTSSLLLIANSVGY